MGCLTEWFLSFIWLDIRVLSPEEIRVKKIRLNKTLRVIFGQYENKTFGLTKLNVSLSFPILN